MACANESVSKRSFMDITGIEWRAQRPDYSLVDKKFMTEKTNMHKEGSIEKIVEDLVKTWEMEVGHKPNHEHWQSIDQEKFCAAVNGGSKHTKHDYALNGSYNLLLKDNPLYDSDKESFDSSHDLFRGVFKSGFAWEVLEVFSGPPNISFTWRHWGKFEGDYKETPATGETIEMFGSCVARVNEKLQIESLELFYDPNSLMLKLAPGALKKTCRHEFKLVL